MNWSWRKAIAVPVVLIVAYVFISPIFALDYSANRAWLAALQVMLTIALMAVLPFAIQEPIVLLEASPEIELLRGSPDSLLLFSISRC
jgi:hypothetical protein